MADLITTARALYNLDNLAATADEETTLAALVSACSRAVQVFCKREFNSQSFDELYRGVDDDKLLLRQYPIISVERVAYNPAAVLRVTNTSAANQRATAAVTSTGITLVRVASGTVTTDTSVTFAGNATINAVATAINALGNGWSASAVANYGLRASADLRAIQGARNALNFQAEFRIHVDDLSEYEIDASRGMLQRTAFYLQDVFPVERATWYGGLNWWRVIYTAGFATIPEDVQEACAQWVAQLFKQTKRDPGLASKFTATESYSVLQKMPDTTRQLLLPYRCHRVGPIGI